MEVPAQPFIQDRRKFNRIRMNLTIFYRIEQPLAVRLVIGGKEIETVMEDISPGGVSFLTTYNLTVGTVLIIRFTLFTIAEDVFFHGPIEIMAEVRHNEALDGHYRVGVIFAEIDPKDAEAIEKFTKKVNSKHK